MTHAKNELIANNLRGLADMIEQSPDEYSASIEAHGGEPRFCLLGDQRLPLGFGPIGAALILGDKGFVESHQVVKVAKTCP